MLVDAIRSDLTDEQLWVSENPKYGTVRHVLINGSFAVVFDDLNSDYREIALNGFEREPSGLWQPIFYTEDVHIPGVGDRIGPWQEHDYVFACGRTEPNTEVTVRWTGKVHLVHSDTEGWWLLAVPL